MNAPRYDTYFLFFIHVYLYFSSSFKFTQIPHSQTTIDNSAPVPLKTNIYVCIRVGNTRAIISIFLLSPNSREKHRLKFFNLFSHSRRHTRTRTLIYIHLFLHNNFQCLQPEQTKGTIKRHKHTYTMTTRQREKHAHTRVQKRTTDVFGCCCCLSKKFRTTPSLSRFGLEEHTRRFP